MNCRSRSPQHRTVGIFVATVGLVSLASCGVGEFDRRYNDRLTKLSQAPTVAATTPAVPGSTNPATPGTVGATTPEIPGTPATPTANELLGEWRIVGMENKGATTPADVVANLGAKITFTNDEMTISTVAAPGQKNRVTLNAAQNPKWIDATLQTEDANKGKTLAGIYSLEGNKLKIAMQALPTDPPKRPTSFQSTPADDFSVMTAER